jgi:hypothetical protein
VNAPARLRLALSPPAEKIVDPVTALVARAEARALLWEAGELTLHDAVDELWASAVRDGLVAKLGADAVQGLLADAFAPVRDDLPRDEDVVPDPISEDEDQADSSVHLKSADDDYEGLGPSFANLCREADEEARRQRALERPAPYRVPKATLDAAEYLLREGNLENWRKWFDHRDVQERRAILEHLEQIKKSGGQTNE